MARKKLSYSEISDEFIASFGVNGGDETSPLKYQEAIAWALGKIEELNDVELHTYTTVKHQFLISKKNEMGLYCRSIRQLSTSKTKKGKPSYNKPHPYGDRRNSKICKIQTAYAACAAFFTRFPTYTLAFSIGNSFNRFNCCKFIYIIHLLPSLTVNFFHNLGSRDHEMAVFIRRPEGTRYKFKSNRHDLLFYDSNVDVNAVKICCKFEKKFTDRSESKVYSTGLHRRNNSKGICGHLVWLELYLYFRFQIKPFGRLNPRFHTHPLIMTEDD